MYPQKVIVDESMKGKKCFLVYYLEADFSAVQRKQFFDTFEHGIETSLLFQEGHVKYVFGPCPQL